MLPFFRLVFHLIVKAAFGEKPGIVVLQQLNQILADVAEKHAYSC